MSLDERLTSAATALRERIDPDAPLLAPPNGRRESRRVRHRTHLVVLGGLAVIMITALLVVTWGGGDSRHTVTVTPPADQKSPNWACGGTLPVTPAIPNGYTGPELGSTLDATPRPAESQLVATWTSGTGGVEIHWPADADLRQPIGTPSSVPFTPPSNGPGIVAASPAIVRQTPSGQSYRDILITTGLLPSQPTTDCQTFQFRVYDRDPKTVAGVVNQILLRPLFLPSNPLVASSADALESPHAVACATPAGFSPVPNGGGPIAGGAPFADPQEALKAFLDAHRSLGSSGYIELRLPDGSISYANPRSTSSGPEPGVYVTVIHVGHAGTGWIVDAWDASGC